MEKRQLGENGGLPGACPAAPVHVDGRVMTPAIAARLGLVAWAVAGLAAMSLVSACGQAPTAPPTNIQASQPADAAPATTPAEATAAAKPAEAAPLKSAEATPVTLPGKILEAPAPPLTDGVYPCSFCHNADLKPNPARRELVQMHGDLVLVHDAPGRLWCVDCHDITDYDSLHLSSGEKVPFDQAYRLCGQCHGRNIRDWAAGVHGRRTGQWNGDKAYLLCANCHSAHVPLFKSLAPMPAPVPPTRAAK